MIRHEAIYLLPNDVVKIACTAGQSMKILIEYEDADTCMSVTKTDERDEHIEYLTQLLADALVSDLVSERE